MMGDFNTLSRFDYKQHEQSNLLSMLKRKDHAVSDEYIANGDDDDDGYDELDRLMMMMMSVMMTMLMLMMMIML